MTQGQPGPTTDGGDDPPETDVIRRVADALEATDPGSTESAISFEPEKGAEAPLPSRRGS